MGESIFADSDRYDMLSRDLNEMSKTLASTSKPSGPLLTGSLIGGGISKMSKNIDFLVQRTQGLSGIVQKHKDNMFSAEAELTKKVKEIEVPTRYNISDFKSNYNGKKGVSVDETNKGKSVNDRYNTYNAAADENADVDKELITKMNTNLETEVKDAPISNAQKIIMDSIQGEQFNKDDFIDTKYNVEKDNLEDINTKEVEVSRADNINDVNKQNLENNFGTPNMSSNTSESEYSFSSGSISNNQNFASGSSSENNNQSVTYSGSDDEDEESEEERKKYLERLMDIYGDADMLFKSQE